MLNCSTLEVVVVTRGDGVYDNMFVGVYECDIYNFPVTCELCSPEKPENSRLKCLKYLRVRACTTHETKKKPTSRRLQPTPTAPQGKTTKFTWLGIAEITK